MKWLRRIITNWVREDWDAAGRAREETRGLNIPMGSLKIKSSSQVYEDDESIRFELSSAIGGRILTIRRWNNKQDRTEGTTYVIPADQDVGERVAKIVNLELFK